MNVHWFQPISVSSISYSTYCMYHDILSFLFYFLQFTLSFACLKNLCLTSHVKSHRLLELRTIGMVMQKKKSHHIKTQNTQPR